MFIRCLEPKGCEDAGRDGVLLQAGDGRDHRTGDTRGGEDAGGDPAGDRGMYREPLQGIEPEGSLLCPGNLGVD